MSGNKKFITKWLRKFLKGPNGISRNKNAIKCQKKIIGIHLGELQGKKKKTMGTKKREDLKANRNILRQIFIKHEEKDRGILAHTTGIPREFEVPGVLWVTIVTANIKSNQISH